MDNFTKTMKLHIHIKDEDIPAVTELTEVYRDGCNFVSSYIFENNFLLNSVSLSNKLYRDLRDKFGLKSQMAQSCIRTATARYKTIKEQMASHPYKYKDENDHTQYIKRNLEWLWKPVLFSRPQADLVRGRDYSFTDGGSILSLNTLRGRIRVNFDIPECFSEYFTDKWSFGTGKIVDLLGEWYFHIPVTKPAETLFSTDAVKHVVGLDRGLRFIITGYDESGKTLFVNGRDILKKRESFNNVRAQLQSRGTKSAKRALKRISGRENRYMTDVNHQISKTLVDRYGRGTLFVIEDLADVSFAEENLNGRSNEQRHQLRSWTFYQLEQFLTYKSHDTGSEVLKVPADYTSQRCPKCGRIHKENRNHKIHEYICDCCGYRSNDDRIGAMNLQNLGTMYISGDTNPRYGARKTE